MGNWQVGLSTGCFYRKSILDVLESIRDSGISVIEICSYPPHLDYHEPEAVIEASQRITELGLTPFSFHAPFADDIDITSPDEEQRDHSLNEIMTAVNAAAHLNVTHFVIHPGPEKDDRQLPEEHLKRLKNAVEVLNQVSEFCEMNGLNLVLENMLPHLSFGRIDDLLWIINVVDQQNPGVCLDTGHANLSGDFKTVVQKLSGYIRMLHVADNKGKSDDHLPPGKGNIDWSGLIKTLMEASFQGALIMELSGDREENGDRILQEAVQARQYLLDIIKK